MAALRTFNSRDIASIVRAFIFLLVACVTFFNFEKAWSFEGSLSAGLSSANAGDAVVVSVDFSNHMLGLIEAADVVLKYDPTVLRMDDLGAVSAGTTMTGFTPTYHVVRDAFGNEVGTVNIGLATFGSGVNAVSGNLVRVNFTVRAAVAAVNSILDLPRDDFFMGPLDNYVSAVKTSNGTGSGIGANQTPVLQTIGNKNVSVGTSLSIELSAADPDAAQVMTFAVSSLPAGAIFNSATGILNWIPAIDQTGTVSLTFTVTDNGTPALSDTETIFITVSEQTVNRAPQIQPIVAQNVRQGDVLDVSVLVSDPDGDAVTLTAASVPDTFVNFNVSDTAITFTPGDADAGIFMITVQANDNKGGSASATFQLTVSEKLNQVPVIMPILAQRVTAGRVLDVTVPVSDPDGDPVTLSVSCSPKACENSSVSGITVRFMPQVSDVGEYTVSVSADDGQGGYSSLSFQLTVANVNQPPVLSAVGARIVNEAQPLLILLSGNDPDGDALAYSATNLPGGAIFNEVTKTLIWVPDHAQEGVYTITFTVSDGSLDASENVKITVINVNTNPVIGDIPDQAVQVGQALDVKLSATDADGDTLIYNVSCVPATFNRFNLAGDTIRFSPLASDAGLYTINATVIDGNGHSVTRSFKLTVSTTPLVPRIVINEVMGSNQGAVTDDLGYATSDWIELKNIGSGAVDIRNFSITDGSQAVWTFQESHVITTGGYLLVWATDNQNDGAQNDLHTNFKIGTTGETITLKDASETTLDSVGTGAFTANFSNGRPLDESGVWGVLSVSSPAGLNSSGAVKFRISEVMSSNNITKVDADGDASDWFEIHNVSGTDADLGGYTVTDSNPKHSWKFPSVVVPADGYVLVWASSKNRVNSVGEFHTDFSLSSDGDILTLRNPQNVIVDTVSTEAQQNDVSWGLKNDQTWGSLDYATPGGDNSVPMSLAPVVGLLAHREVQAGQELAVAVDVRDGNAGDMVALSVTSRPLDFCQTRCSVDGTEIRVRTTAGDPGDAGSYLLEVGALDSTGLAAFPKTFQLTVTNGPSDNPLSGLVINEMQSKTSGSRMVDEDGEYADWIEIYNGSQQEIDLYGFGLSDRLDKPLKWVFGYGTRIPAGGYLVVFASDKDRRSKGAGQNLHTNFKLSFGETVVLSDSSGALIDDVNLKPVRKVSSYGRKPDGKGSFFELVQPTPGAVNNGRAYAFPPKFSLNGGFYDGKISVALLSDMPGAKIRYTLYEGFNDIGEPVIRSGVYSVPISLKRTTVVRAFVEAPDFQASSFVAQTFFINFDSKGMPVISLAVDRDYLNDPQVGLFVQGNLSTVANYEIIGEERPAYAEYYDDARQQAFSQNVGLRIYGGSSRLLFPRPLTIHADSDYGGADVFEYRVFPKKPNVLSYSALNLRFGSQDGGRNVRGSLYNGTYIHQAFLNDVIRGNMDIDFRDSRISVIFLNGEFWGMTDVQERINQQFTVDNYPELTKDDIDVLKFNNGRSSSRSLLPDDRTITREFFGRSVLEYNEISLDGRGIDDFMELVSYMINNDLSQPDKYNYVTERLDISNAIDYFIAESYSANLDWIDNNIRVWRSAPAGQTPTKWRFVQYDVDSAFNNNPNNIVDDNFFEYLYQNSIIFKALLKSPDFRRQFIDRLNECVINYFDPVKTAQIIDAQRDKIAPLVSSHLKRWFGGEVPVSRWDANITNMKNFVIQRPGVLKAQAEEFFRLH